MAPVNESICGSACLAPCEASPHLLHHLENKITNQIE